jgi:histidinol-phosphate/aromatic aminotransferase/cobyric acid decarboxylase-like protein
VFARLNGLIPVATTLEGLAGTGARLIYVCSPNNPTGALVARSTIEALVDQCHAGQVVIIDEAYAEYAGATSIDLALRSDRVLVTRTLSKAFGLAGLRVGYAIGNPFLVGEVDKSRGPYKVAAPSERVAVAALTQGREWVRHHVAEAQELRERLTRELRDRNLEPLPSAANFVYVPVNGAMAIARRMREAGIAIRAFDEPMGLRITVGPWPIMTQMLQALDEALAACA